MSKIDHLCNDYIRGGIREWYYVFNVAGVEFSGGAFFRRKNARDSLKAKLRTIILNDWILVDYLERLANG